MPELSTVVLLRWTIEDNCGLNALVVWRIMQQRAAAGSRRGAMLDKRLLFFVMKTVTASSSTSPLCS